MLLVSLWLHLTLILLMVVTVRYDRVEEELPPPSTVAMVFEGGTPEGPALPHPQPNVTTPSEPPTPPTTAAGTNAPAAGGYPTATARTAGGACTSSTASTAGASTTTRGS